MNRKTALAKCAILLIIFSCISTLSFSQNNFRVSGKVIDETGKPVSGATVTVKGTSIATATTTAGAFALNVPSGKSVLVVTSIGFGETEIAINDRAEITVAMASLATSLQDVVVVGYGTQKKSDVTGALSRITAETIQERPAQNVLQALQGKAPGVHVSSNLKPGELPVVRIRGTRSLTASNDPLYVIDGIPMVNALGVNSFTMNDIDPNDIASMEILKDASATAIYGSRGANGVVLITTKKGKKGRVSVSYNATLSFDRYQALTDWMDGGQYVDRWRESLINGRLYNPTIPNNGNLNVPAVSWYPTPRWDSAMVGTVDPIALKNVMGAYEWNPDGTVKMRPTTPEEKALGWPDMVPMYNSSNIKTYDWLEDATRQGITQSHQLSLTSGTDIARLSISLNYYGQKGVQMDQNYKRFNTTINGDITANKWLTVGTSLIASLSVQNYGIQGPNTSNTGSKDLYSRATDMFPYGHPYDYNGIYVKNPGGNINLWNPLIDITQSKNERRSTAILASIFTEIKFTSWLKYRMNLSGQYRYFRSGTWTGPDATSHLKTPNTAGYATQDNFSWVVENLLYFTKTFSDVHNLQVTLLQSSQKSRRENSSISVAGTINPLSMWYDVASNTNGNPSGYGTGYTENSLSSFMGRVNYNLMDKYIVTASGRYDGSSVLAPGYKWNFFPSFAVAWKLSKEGFLQNFDWINELKPRIGWGITGNSSVDPYTTSGPLSRNPYVFAGTAAIGYLPQLVQNPLLKWEETEQTNFGLDFTFFRGRVSGSLEYYIQNTEDLIMTKSLPAVSGYVQKIENIGKTKNYGFEVTLATVNIKKGHFSWNTDLNWARNHEEIVELINGKQDMVAQNWFIGRPTQVYYQLENAGIWSSDSKDLAEMAKFNANGHRFYPGTIRPVDRNGDYRINASDYVVLGSPRPQWTGGITNTFHYKNWSLSSFIYFRWGQTYFGGYPNSYGGANPNGRVENDVWTWNNQSGRWPMPNFANVENLTSSMQYNDGSFGVVRNISLSYVFPKSMISRLSINDLVVNFQVLNPFMWGPGVVKWGLNPDDDTNWSIASSNTNPLGGTNNNTILSQSFVFGIRAGF